MKKAFFTVELALLMPVIFLSVFSMVEMTFYVHDRSVLVSESARAAFLIPPKDGGAELSFYQNELTRHLIASEGGKMEQTESSSKRTVLSSAGLPLSTSSRKPVKEKVQVRNVSFARVLRLFHQGKAASR